MPISYKSNLKSGYNSRRRRARPEAVADILRLALKKRGLEKDIARYQFFRHWDEIVGAEIAKRAQPECMRGTTLVVRVSDSMWAQELSFQRDVILKRVLKYAGDKMVLSDLHFYVNPQPLK